MLIQIIVLIKPLFQKFLYWWSLFLLIKPDLEGSVCQLYKENDIRLYHGEETILHEQENNPALGLRLAIRMSRCLLASLLENLYRKQPLESFGKHSVPVRYIPCHMSMFHDVVPQHRNILSTLLSCKIACLQVWSICWTQINWPQMTITTGKSSSNCRVPAHRDVLLSF